MAKLSVINPSTPLQKLTATPPIKFTIDKPGLTSVANIAYRRQLKPEGK